MALWGKIEAGESGENDLDSLYRLMHSLAGSGETFGFPQLSKTAQHCERILLDGIESGVLKFDEAKTAVDSVLAELRN